SRDRRPSGCLLDHDPGWRSRARALALDAVPRGLGDLAIDLRVAALWLRHDDRPALVRGEADLEVEGHLAQERHAQPLGLVARAAMAEDLRLGSAVRADEGAHVLDDAQHRHTHALEHREAFAR